MPFRNVYFSITAVIVCASFFFLKLFALKKLLVLIFCFLIWFLWLACFFETIQYQMVASKEVIKIKLMIQNIGITGDERNHIIHGICS